MEKEKKLSKEQFVIQAIEKLRTDKSKGIHVVYSGFNGAFEKYFGEPSRATTEAMIAAGKLEGYPVKKGGFRIYKKGEMPSGNSVKKIDQTLARITG